MFKNKKCELCQDCYPIEAEDGFINLWCDMYKVWVNGFTDCKEVINNWKGDNNG